MNYFTPDLYLQLQDFSSDDAMDAADAAWEAAAARYRRALKRLLPELPKGLRSLTEDYYLHDAEILSMGGEGQTFVIVLRLDAPPHELVVLTYRLRDTPEIDRNALKGHDGSGAVQWMYDEVGAVRGKQPAWSHSILLSNGWEVRLRVRDVKVQGVKAILPASGAAAVRATA